MIEIQVLSKILNSKDYSLIKKNLLTEDYFETYKEEFKFLEEHYNKYKNVPDVSTFLEKFPDFDVIDVTESDKYLVDRIREEHLFSMSAPIMQKASDLYKEDANKAVEYILTQFKNIKPNYGLGGTDIIQDSMRRYEDYIDRKENQEKFYFSTGFKELDQITHGIQRSEEFIVIFARINQGKCLEKGTKVLMWDGTLKNIEDIIVGDKVRTINGINTVKALHSGKSDGYKIIPIKKGKNGGSGKEFTVSSNHILTLWKTNYSTQEKGEIVDIKIEDYLSLPFSQRKKYKLYRTPGIEYPTKKLKIPPYILGIWLGDGTSRSPELTSIDKEIINEWEKFANINGVQMKKRGEITYPLSNKKGKVNPVLELFRELNVLNNKHIPLEYLTGDRGQRLELLAGLIDTDGWLEQVNNAYCITQKNEKLIDEISRLCTSLGFKWYKKKGFNKKYKTYHYSLSIYGKTEEIPVRLERKKMRPTRTLPMRNPLTCSFTIEKKSNIEYYGFECDGDHRFLLEDGTVTHNSWVIQKMCTSVWEQGYNVGYISPEMTAESVGYRFDTLHKNFSNSSLTWGKNEGFDNEAYKQYLAELGKKKNKLIVATLQDFNKRITISKLRNWITQNELDMIAIDGITYLSDERYKKGDNKTTSLTNISEDLMSLSVEMNIPILGVVQANRGGVVEEDSGTPELETIRDSDGLGMNASKVISLRQKYGILEIGIKKQRNGKVGDTLRYTWNIDTGEFTWIPSETENLPKEMIEEKIQENKDQYDDIEDIF